MLSAAETAKIKAEIVVLEKSRDSCSDSGIRELLEAWIRDKKEKLESERSDA
jgi:hypothetical protein